MDKLIKNAMLTGSSSVSLRQYVPKQYKDRQKQYFNSETRLFNEYYAKYSTDYIEAQIQGLNPENPFDYTTVHVRFSDIVRSSSAISYEFDNYKVIDIAEREYTYVRIGAKIIAMGSTWLAINPDNMGNPLGKTIIQRCDSVWHYLDYYGNVCSEPLCFDRRLAKANDTDAQRATMITKGYFDCYVQYNKASKQLFTNSRIILGSSAYHITGYSDFIQEFTDDYDSINLLGFNVRYEEPNDAVDDMENHVANGKTFAWNIVLQGESALKIGDTQQITAKSVRTAEENTEEVKDTAEHPVFYHWESSDEDVCTVDYFGNVEAVSEGECTITATLAQNTNISSSFPILVTEVDETPHLAFDQTVQSTLTAYKSMFVSATYYEGGVETSEIVQWSFSGADPRSYSTEINGNIVKISCWGGSVAPLKVTATYGEEEISAEIYMEGI